MEIGERVFVWNELTYEQQTALYERAFRNSGDTFYKGDKVIPIPPSPGRETCVYYNTEMRARCVGVVKTITSRDRIPKCGQWYFDPHLLITPEQYEEVMAIHEVEITEADAAGIMNLVN